MKHLLLTMEYPPQVGGIATYLSTLVSLFPDRFEVVASKGVSHPLFFKVFWPKWLRSFWVIYKNRKQVDDVWVSHVIPLGTVAWMARRLWGKPYVVILHGFDVMLAESRSRHRWLLAHILNNARVVICNTRVLERDVRALHPTIRSAVVHPTLSTSFSQIVSRERENGVFRVLTVSRLVKRKNHEAVLRALAECTFPWHYTIAGDGPERESLERLSSVLGISDRVRFLGLVSDTDRLDAYAKADVFILPARRDSVDREGFGIVYLEAAAYGLPIIATDLDGVREAVDSKGSILLKEPSQEAIRGALERLAGDKNRREEMGKANTAFAQNHGSESMKSEIQPYV